MNRAFKIIIIIILIITTILFGAWFLARRQAIKEGETAPTFRQFLNFGTTPQSQTPQAGNGGLIPDIITTPDNTPTGTTGSAQGETQPTTSSNFTSGPITPASGPLAQGGSTSTNPGTNTSPVTQTPAAPRPGTTTPAPTPGSSTPVVSTGCSDADLTISFTPAEISKLNTLQNRFYAIAQTLHTDTDVQTELENYNLFRAKADQISELYDYCQLKAPLIQNPAVYKNRIATPFWRDAAKDVRGYIVAKRPFDSFTLFAPNEVVVDPRDVTTTQSIFERIFRLNLW